MGLSFLPLASRLSVPLSAGCAVVEGRLAVPLGGGATSDVAVRLLLSGSGRLPVLASDVRGKGWEGAWQSWLSGHAALTVKEGTDLVQASPLWATIFPGDPPLSALDLTSRLATAFAPLRLVRAEVVPDISPDLVRGLAQTELARRTERHGRLVVLGLDALDWSLVDDLVKRGRMPALSRLMREGVQAVEDVPPPLISPVVWTTIATGVPPEAHGVLDFLEPDPAGGPPRPATGASRRVPALWEMAAAAAGTTAVVGWWATYPAQAPAGGTVYSDRLTEQLLGLSERVPGLADPPAAEQAANALALHAADVTPAMLAPFLTVGAGELAAVLARSNAWDDPIGGLAKLVAATETVERLTSRELDRGTEVVLSYLEGTDTVGHLFGPYRPPALPGTDPALARRFADVVDRYHAHVDAWVGAVARRLGPNDTLVVVSDHGFTWGADRPRVPSGAHTATAEMWHLPQGVFLAAGPGIRPSAERHRIGALDIAPVLLALAGLPRGAEMPGRVPEWLLSATDHRGGVNYAALLPPGNAPKAELPPKAAEEQLAKLRALGYIAGGEERKPAGTEPTARLQPSDAPTEPTPTSDRAEARRLNNLAISLASSGDKERAEETFRNAIAADPEYAPPYYSLSVMMRKQGRLEEADKLFWAALRVGVREPETSVVRLALDYVQRGMPGKAGEVFAKGRELYPESATIWLNSGVFLGEHGDLSGARTCLERAAALDPTNSAAYRNLAAALLGLGDREGARRALTRALDLAPGDAATRRQLEGLGGPLR